MIDLNKIKRLPPTQKLPDNLPKPKLSTKGAPPKRTWVNKVIYYAVEYADDADKVGDVIVAYTNKNLSGRLKYVGLAVGYAVKYLGGYIDKNIARADKKGK